MSIITRPAFAARALPPNQVLVSSPYQMEGTLRSDVAYIITGDLDWSGAGVSIEVPATGLFIEGINQVIRSINVSDDDFTLFTSPVGGSGNLFISGVTFRVSGNNSRVYDLTDVNGTHAVEVDVVNYENCTSLGTLNGYRQILELNTGRFGGTPELTLAGTMNGCRVSTSIVRGSSNYTSLFKAGAGLLFSGRFVSDINCDLPSVGALLDFSPSNFSKEELLQLSGCIITRNGVSNPLDAGILPNISNQDVQSLFKGNSGITNTKKYLKANCTTEVTTNIVAQNTYYPLAGTMSVESSSHISMPSNGVYEVGSGASTYSITGDFVVSGNASDVIDLRVTLSTDGGITFPSTVNHVSRVVNNIVGPRDVAFIPVNFIGDFKKGDRLRVEVENKSSSSDVTLELDSFISIKED